MELAARIVVSPQRRSLTTLSKLGKPALAKELDEAGPPDLLGYNAKTVDTFRLFDVEIRRREC
eukprot:scaffold1029_cov364-Pinguiococcus_pyrenoidosus.AAC.2